MKFWMIGIVLVVLGLGEWTYVEVAPYPPDRRMQQFTNLPFVKPFAKPILKAVELRAADKMAVEGGDPWDYQLLYYVADKYGDEDRMARAKELLHASDTAAARWVTYRIEHRTKQLQRKDWEPERTILYLQMVAERIRSTITSEEDLERWQNWYKNELQELHEKAENGDENARKIVGALDAPQSESKDGEGAGELP